MSSKQQQSSEPVALAERWSREALEVGRLEEGRAEQLAGLFAEPGVLDALLEAADECRARGRGSRVTVARNVFIPLTNLCRDRCDYCTFAKLPDSPEAKTYEIEEVREVVRGGLATGCTEALLCLGDKPEVAYRSHRAWLAERGWGSTAEQLVDACQAAFEAGMLPHTNAGILSQEEMSRLRPWNASMGLMLETTSERLRERGMPHYYAPDKAPEKRLRMHREAGELKIPFTSGILLGIGENDAERAATLDLLSGGRFELGLAKSGGKEWETFGVDPDCARDQLREAIEVIPRMWSDEPFEWHSEHLEVPEREVLPKPLQKLPLPLHHL